MRTASSETRPDRGSGNGSVGRCPNRQLRASAFAGRGTSWYGSAAMNSIAAGFDPYDEQAEETDGQPLWAVWPENTVDGTVIRGELGRG